MFKSNINSGKFLNYFSTKFYTTNINTLLNCNSLKSFVLSPHMLSSTSLVSNDIVNIEDGLIKSITGNGIHLIFI